MKPARSWRRGVLLGLVLLAASASTVSAQSQIFLEFIGPAIVGEATAPGFQNQIDITAASHGIVNPACSGSKSGGIPSEFTFTKRLDRASVDMYTALNARSTFGTAKFRFARDVGGTLIVYQEYEFLNVILSAASAAGTVADSRPVESWSLSYSQLTIKYTYIDPKGGTQTESVVIVPAACVGS